MKFANIKTRWLRRAAMIVLSPYIVVTYAYLGLKDMVRHWGECWNYQYPV
jgi:hypothetical protein